MHSESLILFFIVSLVLVGGAITFAHLLHPVPKSAEARSYECGIPTKGVTGYI